MYLWYVYAFSVRPAGSTKPKTNWTKHNNTSRTANTDTNKHHGRALAGSGSGSKGNTGVPPHPGAGRPASPDPAANRHDYDSPWQHPWRAGSGGGSGTAGGRGGFVFPGVRPGGVAGSAGGGGGGGGTGGGEGGAEQRRNALSQMLDEDPSERRLVAASSYTAVVTSSNFKPKWCQDKLARLK